MTQDPHDVYLQARIVEELMWTACLDADRIDVSVDDGDVTLSGDVDTLEEKALAIEAPSRVPGVSTVIDHLGVRSVRAEPHHRHTAADAWDLAHAVGSSRAVHRSPSGAPDRVLAALRRDVGVDAETIHVDTTHVDAKGTAITLTGTVRSWAESNRACHAAWAVPGVTKVDNRLLVV